MKTEVFGDYYLAVLPSKSSLEWVEEEKDDIVRDMYFDQGKLEAVLMKNDGSRSKIYQTALMEKWTRERINRELPL
ncbi:hypothetical protein [Saccharicrinis fermentans]|nr:hypothetical protein [Saccharicrinis fermentans]